MTTSTCGDRLRAERINQGFTQDQLARGISVTKNAISAIERGETKNPRPETLFALADFLQIDPRWLITGRGAKGSEALVREGAATYDAPTLPVWANKGRGYRSLWDAINAAYAKNSLTDDFALAFADMIDRLGTVKHH